LIYGPKLYRGIKISKRREAVNGGKVAKIVMGWGDGKHCIGGNIFKKCIEV